MGMLRRLIFTFTFLLLPFSSNSAQLTDEQLIQVIRSLNWIQGPTTVAVGNNANFTVPENYVFLNPSDTKRMMEAYQNPSSGNEYYFGPSDMRWWALFQYSETGHIPDDETIEAGPLLDSIKTATEASNQERAKLGWPSMTIVGWRYQPFYDPQTKRLDWAIDGQSGNDRVINYNTRILSRTGVTSATLVADPAILDTAVPEFKYVVTGYQFNSGQRYSEFTEGDHVAEYGLAALIAGGTAAVAAKKGFWAAIAGFFAIAWKFILAGWKFIAIAAVGLFTWVASLFKKKS